MDTATNKHFGSVQVKLPDLEDTALLLNWELLVQEHKNFSFCVILFACKIMLNIMKDRYGRKKLVIQVSLKP